MTGKAGGRGKSHTYAKVFDPDLDLGWMEQAPCKGSHPEFDYDQGRPSASGRRYNLPLHVQHAQKVCLNECPVRVDCLDFALRIEAPRGRSGVYGGLTPNERDALYDKQRGRIA